MNFVTVNYYDYCNKLQFIYIACLCECFLLYNAKIDLVKSSDGFQSTYWSMDFNVG